MATKKNMSVKWYLRPQNICVSTESQKYMFMFGNVTTPLAIRDPLHTGNMQRESIATVTHSLCCCQGKKPNILFPTAQWHQEKAWGSKQLELMLAGPWIRAFLSCLVTKKQPRILLSVSCMSLPAFLSNSHYLRYARVNPAPRKPSVSTTGRCPLSEAMSGLNKSNTGL